MRRIIYLAVGLLLIVAFAGCETTTESGKDMSDNNAAKTGATTTEDVAEPEATPRVREAANPDGKFSSSCDIAFPEDFTSGDYAFVAAAKMRNTGNVGIVVRVRARFDQVASENVTDEKTVRIPVGKRRTAKFRIPATQTQVDEHQNSPDYFNGDACKVSVKIMDSFGKPPFED